MRGFIVLCLSAVAIAAPQGYNYPAQGGLGGGISGGFVSGGHSSSSSGFGSSGHSGSNGFSNGGHSGSGLISGGYSGGGFVSGGQGGASFAGVQQQQQQQQTIISKRFYIHSAPEENDEDFREKTITVGQPRKNYNVVFIRAPSKTSRRSSIKVIPAVNEEKTVIYVLSKKADASDLQAEVIETAAPTTKPEVFFIKYKTNEEAAHAQQQIQAQYDSLGGSSQVSDEGVAPVSSVIGALGGGAGGDTGAASGAVGHIGGGGSISHQSGVGAVSAGGSGNAYLPPHF